jgi:predicted transcriptional regulator
MGVELMPPDQRSSATTTGLVLATDLALAGTRGNVRSAVEDLHKARAAHAAILEARCRSVAKDAGIVEASQRLISASRELLRSFG